MNGHAVVHCTHAAPIKACRSEWDGRYGGGGAQSADQVMRFILGLSDEVVRVVVSRCVFFVRALAILAAMHGLERAGLALFLVGGVALDASHLTKTNQHDDPGGPGLTGLQRRFFFCKGPNWMSDGSSHATCLPWLET